MKAQLEALNSKGYEFIKNQIEFFFKEKGIGGDSKVLEKLLLDNEELRKMIKELLTNGLNSSMTDKSRDVGGSGKFRPPIPIPGYDGDIAQGFSYKFETHLDVVDKNGKPGIG